MHTEIDSLLIFLKEIDRLKSVERQCLIHNGGRHENSAEHSWHLALAALLFQGQAAKGIDINKAIKMALLHDIVEIDAGDTFIYADQAGKKEKELAAFQRLMSLLPSAQAIELTKIWEEFEEGQSQEAQYVQALDRFLPLYSNYLNEGYSWKKHGIQKAQVIAKNKPPMIAALPALWEKAQAMVDGWFKT
jgi:putative hydrolases of HD superfamily